MIILDRFYDIYIIYFYIFIHIIIKTLIIGMI
jgi:hypothetical protein